MRALQLTMGLILFAAPAFAQTSRADLCAELSSFIAKQDQSKSQPPKEAATAVQAPSAKTERPQAGGSDQSQQSSGISGPVTHGGPGAAGPQADAQESAKSGAVNPKAQASPPPPKDVPQPMPADASAEAMQAAQQAAQLKDALACRKATQDLRRAGVDMPPDLLALGALDPKFLSPQAEQK